MNIPESALSTFSLQYQMATLEEIARLANVSRSTVSRVLNQEPNVSEETRDRVKAVLRQTNFQPNRAARSLAGGRTRVLGLVIPHGIGRLFTDPYFPTLIQAVTSACNANDHSLMLWLAEPEYESRMVGQILNNGLVDGLLITSVLADDPVVHALGQGNLPFLIIGRAANIDRISYVDIDNQNGARSAVSYLLRNGRRRIATITGPLSMVPGTDRLEGYLTALRERGITPPSEWIAESDFSEEGGYEAAKTLLPHHLDAIFCASDMMAVGALRALQEAGLEVPGKVALIGFDDNPLAARTDPPLTTVRQPIQRMGSTAVEVLIDQIETNQDDPRRIILPTELVIRGSA